MLTTAKLFQLLNEATVLLLGALLILLAVSGRAGLPTRPAALIALGVVFIYWGARAWIRPEPSSTRWAARYAPVHSYWSEPLFWGIPISPSRFVPLLLDLTGGVLVLRGILGVVLLARSRRVRPQT